MDKPDQVTRAAKEISLSEDFSGQGIHLTN